MTGKKGMIGSGGKREGAGRKLIYGEETTPLQIKVPISKKAEIKTKFAAILKKYETPNKKQK